MDLSQWREWDEEYARELEKYGSAIPSRRFIQSQLQEALSLRSFIAAFGLDEAQSQALKQRIRAMLNAGQLQRLSRGRIQATQAQTVQGKVFLHPDGYGFFSPEDGGDDGFLAPQHTDTLMHGDIIRARVDFVAADGRKEYQPLEIVQRAYSEVAGVLVREAGGFFLRSPQKRLPLFHVSPQQARPFALGSVLRGRIERYPSRHQLPQLQDLHYVGQQDDAHMHNRLAMLNQHIPHVFPGAVLAEAAALPEALCAEDYAGRRDLRALPFVTIDGADARDFDDAVCVQKTAQGWRLYVAIADVAHYVPAGSALDAEAQQRGTSVYFPDMVVPMLPEALSNGLCSLNPRVDRLALVCTLSFNQEGQLKQSRFARAVIHSRERLTYEAAQAVLFDGAACPWSKAVERSLRAAADLFRQLLRRRQERGALSFELPEAKFEYDRRGKIVHIHGSQRLASHQLIEEFMVVANVAAAKFLEKHRLSALYRVHEAPNERNQKELRLLARAQGLHWPKDEMLTPLHIDALIQSLAEHPQRSLYEYKILRLMMPAYYFPRNGGHFGLALSHYCHFTSPIRRYPDLTVHRAIISQLEGQPQRDLNLLNLAQQCSEYERRAEDVSREVLKGLKCDYLSQRRQQIFSGVISRVQAMGLWVTLDEVLIEGLVHISQLDGFFIYDEQRELLRAQKSKQVYQWGDRVEVLIQDIDLENHKIQLRLRPSKADSRAPERSKVGKAKARRRRGKKHE